jgi:hypothetical protein
LNFQVTALASNKADNVRMYKRNIETRSRKYCCSGKAGSITYSVCVFVTLGIGMQLRMRHIVLSSVVCPAISYFSTCLSNGMSFFKRSFDIKFVL